MPTAFEFAHAVNFNGSIRTAWEFEHAADVNAPVKMAWEFWTNVENWKFDPSVEWVRLDGDFRAGAVGETKQHDQPPTPLRIIEVREAERCVIELDLLYLTFRLEMNFEPVSEDTSRLRQRVTLDAPEDSPFAAGLRPEAGDEARAGMKKLAEAVEQYAAASGRTVCPHAARPV